VIIVLLVFVLGCFAIFFFAFGLGSLIGIVGAVAKRKQLRTFQRGQQGKRYFCPRCRTWLTGRPKFCSQCGLGVTYPR
jgi:hypothetical protein